MSESKKIRSTTPNVYAVIPAVVRYDRDLRPNAKLLYGEITALTNFKGYCYATNDYFARLYSLSKKTVGELIAQLEKKGLIEVIVDRDAESNEFVERKIYLADVGYEPPCAPSPEKYGEGAQEQESAPESGCAPSPEKSGDLPRKIGGPPPKNRNAHNIINNNTPYSPPEGERAHAAHFDSFWEAYPKKKDKQRAVRAFRRLKVTEPMLAMMLSALEIQKRSPDWRKDGGQYVPLPSSWLNGRRWEDDEGKPPPVAEAAAPGYRRVVEEEYMPTW